MTTLRIQSIPLRPVFETDIRGQIVEPDRARTLPFEVSCDLDLTQRRLSFNIIASVPKTIASDERQASQIAVAWLTEDLPSRLANHGYWNFFEYTHLSVGHASRVDVREWAAFECDVTLSPGIAAAASAACDEIARIEAKFKLARNRLNDLAFNNYALGFKQTLSEARGYFRTIEEVLNANATLGGYRARDARNALRNYEELARRQVESNHNYQSALTSLQQFVTGVSLPQIWGRLPA